MVMEGSNSLTNNTHSVKVLNSSTVEQHPESPQAPHIAFVWRLMVHSWMTSRCTVGTLRHIVPQFAMAACICGNKNIESS